MAAGSMIWQDLLLDRWVDGEMLCAAMASAFGISADTMTLSDTPEQLLAISPSARVILERDRQHRDFPLQILVVLRDEDLASRFGTFDGALKVARVLAQRLDVVVLFAEGPLAPSEWVRVRPTGNVHIVLLDVDETGEGDSFFVVAERPFAGNQPLSATEPTRLTA